MKRVASSCNPFPNLASWRPRDRVTPWEKKQPPSPSPVALSSLLASIWSGEYAANKLPKREKSYNSTSDNFPINNPGSRGGETGDILRFNNRLLSLLASRALNCQVIWTGGIFFSFSPSPPFAWRRTELQHQDVYHPARLIIEINFSKKE